MPWLNSLQNCDERDCTISKIKAQRKLKNDKEYKSKMFGNKKTSFKIFGFRFQNRINSFCSL